MRSKWQQFEKEGFDPYIWIFTNGDTLSIKDNLWARKVKQDYFNLKIKNGNQNDSTNFTRKK